MRGVLHALRFDGVHPLAQVLVAHADYLAIETAAQFAGIAALNEAVVAEGFRRARIVGDLRARSQSGWKRLRS